MGVAAMTISSLQTVGFGKKLTRSRPELGRMQCGSNK
jgi:hypothetical protein